MVNQEAASPPPLSEVARLFFTARLLQINLLSQSVDEKQQLLTSHNLGRELLRRQFILENLVPHVPLTSFHTPRPQRLAKLHDLGQAVSREMSLYQGKDKELGAQPEKVMEETVDFMIQVVVDQVKIIPLSSDPPVFQLRLYYLELGRKLQLLRRVFGYNAPSLSDGD